MKLRNYQVDCVDRIIELIDERSKKIVYLATGLGKTIIMASVISKLYNENKRTLVVVDQEELVEQTIDKILIYDDSINRNDIGVVKGSVRQVDRRIIISTRQTLTSKRNNTLEQLNRYEKFSVAFVDETHRGLKQVERVLEVVGEVGVVGLTATPFNPMLNKIYDGFLYEKDILESIEEGFLCDIKYKSRNTAISLDNVKTSCGDFNQKELDNAINVKDRNQLIVDAYLQNAKGRNHAIVYCTSIEHSSNVAELFNENGVSSASLDSSIDSSERKRILKDFKNGTIKVLTNVNILTTGFDFPQLDMIIFARPTRSQILYTQAMGRGLRTSDGKENLLLIDLIDDYKNDLVNMRTLFDIRNNELLTEVKENRTKEELEKKQREKEEREKQLLEEQLALEEDIRRFSSNVMNIFSVSKLDWWTNTINRNVVMQLMAHMDLVYYIFKKDDMCYLYKNVKVENKWYLELIEEDENLYEILDIVEQECFKHGSGFIRKNAKWKQDKVTPNQLKYVKDKDKDTIKTKWDCNKYFHNKTSYFSLKDII